MTPAQDSAARMLDRPAPRWIVAATDWLSGRPWLPQGLAKLWGCGYEREFWSVFAKHQAPVVTWAHVLGRRNYRREASEAYQAGAF